MSRRDSVTQLLGGSVGKECDTRLLIFQMGCRKQIQEMISKIPVGMQENKR